MRARLCNKHICNNDHVDPPQSRRLDGNTPSQIIGITRLRSNNNNRNNIKIKLFIIIIIYI